MSDKNKVGFTSGIGIHNYAMSETESLREENSRLKLELEKIKYKIMKDDVEKGLDLYYYFMTHWNKDRFLGWVVDGKFLELFSEAFNVGRSQMIIDKYNYDDVVTVVKNFCEELEKEKEKEKEKAKLAKEEQEEEGDEE